MLTIAVVGSRAYPNLDRVQRFVGALAVKHPECVIVSGGACGVDVAAAAAARAAGLRVREWPAQWPLYGKSAGVRRSALLVQQADVVVAFWDGQSKGTAHTIELAHRYGRKVVLYR